MGSDAIKGISRKSAQDFTVRWKQAKNEKQEAQTFWHEFFRDVCGITDLKQAGIEFEKPVTNSTKGNTNWIDVYWQDVLLIEHKSAGKDLQQAEAQARSYLVSLPPKNRPPIIVISDFQNFVIIDVLLNNVVKFPLSELSDNLDIVETAFGIKKREALAKEIEVDQKAAALMADLYQEFENAGFRGHEVSVFLVRILFLLFGDDTRMFKNNLFKSFVEDSSDDGRDLGGRLQELFIALDTPKDKRTRTSDEFISDFPYVNGGLFSETLPIFAFSLPMRSALLAACNYDWAKISPAIFGSMFQLIKSKELRRSLGEHYTSETNIHKVIDPLFMDQLQDELVSSWDNKSKLKSLRLKLSKFKFLDPACGCGNFLVVTYKAMRQLELEIIRRLLELEGKTEDLSFDGTLGLQVTLNQFIGIEIEEWSSQIAMVALFLADHQENIMLEKITGDAPERFPLTKSPSIFHQNALEVEWDEITKIDKDTFIFGNPPFIGSKERTPDQSNMHSKVWAETKAAGSLDFVTCWFLLAAKMINRYDCSAAFVSTNSITQGRQPDVLWEGMKAQNIKIDFAHQSFRWSNESSGQAIVTCVVIGFSSLDRDAKRRLWIRDSDTDAPKVVSQINPYLAEGGMTTTPSRKQALSSQLSPASYGSIGYDEGFLMVDEATASEIKKTDLVAFKYLRPIIGGRELLHNETKFCLWLQDASPEEMIKSSFIQSRISEVAAFRRASNRSATQKLAETPWLFGEIRQPNSDYVAIAKVSSEKRDYLPCAVISSSIVASGSILTIVSDNPYLDFALVCSRPMSIWNKTVSGRMKTDYQVSVEITYNNFPMPEIDGGLEGEITNLAQEVIETRSTYPESKLSTLYDNLVMPQQLKKAHKKLDALMLQVFDLKETASDSEVLTVLFQNYEKLLVSHMAPKSLFS